MIFSARTHANKASSSLSTRDKARLLENQNAATQIDLRRRVHSGKHTIPHSGYY